MLGKRAMNAPSDSAGVVTRACVYMGDWCNTGNPGWWWGVSTDRRPARVRPDCLGWREARMTVEAG